MKHFVCFVLKTIMFQVSILYTEWMSSYRCLFRLANICNFILKLTPVYFLLLKLRNFQEINTKMHEISSRNDFELRLDLIQNVYKFTLSRDALILWKRISYKYHIHIVETWYNSIVKGLLLFECNKLYAI